MPIDFRRFKKEIERAGLLVEQTSKGHYWVMSPAGSKLEMFAVSHSKRRRNEVLDVYVKKIRKVIQSQVERRTVEDNKG